MDKSEFLRLVNSPWRMRLYLLRKLPAAWFLGIQVLRCDAGACSIRLPFHWQSKNPFQSIYFAAQCAAGELSTGLLVMATLAGQPPVSMLVINIEAEFLKKAAARLNFTCTEGAQVESAVRQALSSTEAQVLRLHSTGRLPDGTVAANIWITWSLKRRVKK